MMLMWHRLCCRCASRSGYDKDRPNWCSVCERRRVPVPTEIWAHAEFLERVIDAREDGSIFICAQCAFDEESDEHEEGCPNIGRDPFAEQMEFLAERLGPEKTAELIERASERDAEGEA